ncbi:hypothetical protein GCM10027442_31370 [Emticicia fontis]
MAQNPRGVPGPDPTTERSFNNLYALIIGISDYKNKDIVDLKYAHEDAKLFFTYLQTFYSDFLKKGDERNYKVLLDSMATQTNVNEGLEWLLGKATNENDLVIIYFAGHGNIERGDPYFYCHDASKINMNATAIPFSRINKDLLEYSKRKVQSIFIADACHSGLVNADYFAINKAMTEEIRELEAHRLLSSKDKQVSIESDILCNGHGFFTYYLIKGLLGEADGRDSDTNEKDGMITIHELDTYLQKDLYSATKQQQTPKIITNNDRFIVGRKLSEIPEAFNCLLELGKSSGFQYAKPEDDDTYIKKTLSNDKKKIYDLFLLALKDKRFLSPTQNNAIYYFEKLQNAQVSKLLITEITSQWKVVFGNYAQNLLNKYLASGKIPVYQEYELGAALLKKSIEYSDKNDENLLDLEAKYTFLENYALHRKYSQYEIIMPKNELNQIYYTGIAKIKTQISKKTDIAYLHYLLGRFYEVVGEKQKSLLSYTVASNLAPNWDLPKYRLLVLNKSIGTSYRLKEFENLTKSSPEFTDFYLETARLYRAYPIKNFDKSLEFIQKAEKKAIEIEEDNAHMAVIYAAFGNHYWAIKDYKKAEEFFLKALSKNNKYSYGYDLLSSMFRDLGKYSMAIEYAQKGLSVNPYDNDLLDDMAWANMNLKKYEESEVWFKKKMLYDSLNSYSYFTLARVNKILKRWSLAESFGLKGFKIAEAKRDSTEMSRCLTELGSIKSEQEEYAGAIPYFEQAIKIDPTYEYAYYYMAFNYQYWKKYDEAILYFKKYGNFGYSAEGDIAYLKSLQGKPKEAITYYKAASKKAPKNSDILNNIAIKYNEIGKKDSAVYFTEKAVFNIDYFESKDYQGLYSYYMDKVKTDDSKMAYYALGLIWERGLGREKNLKEAVKWYRYAAQMIYWPATDRLLDLYERGKLVENKERMLEFLKNSTTGKKFTIPSKTPEGEKISVDIFITDAPINEANPIEGEVNRVKEIFNAQIPEEVISSFAKLYDLAKKNNVSFGALCVYALEAANKEKKNQDVGNHIDYEKEAQKFNPVSQGDSILVNTERAIIEKYSGLLKMDFSEAYDLAIKGIVSNNEKDDFLLYYVLGYLYETSSTNKNINKAIRWYMYAFQMGYKPAYVKLRKLFRFISESKVEWLDKNFKKGFTPHTVTASNNASVQKSYKIYLLDFPSDFSNPLKQEEERLKEVYEFTISTKIVAAFKTVYDAATKEKVSFQDLYKKVIEDEERKKITSNDQQHIDSGIDLLKNNKLTEAKAQFDAAIQLNANNSRAYFCRGVTYYYLKEFENSKTDLERAIKLVDDNASYYEYLGDVYIQLVDYTKAKDVYTKAYELGNNKSNGLCYNLACIYSLEKRSVKALRFFEEALENGYKDFDHIKKDTDLDYIRDISRFKELVEKYSKK